MSGIVDVTVLRDAVVNKKPVELMNDDMKVEDINESNKVKIGEKIYDILSPTNFYNEDQASDLKTIIFCWIHDKSSVVEYKKKCNEYKIPDFKFLVKTELTTWLNGNSESCKFIKTEGGETNGESKKHKLDDPQLLRISEFEKESIDHNIILRGTKNIDFGYLIKDAQKFIAQLKRNKPSKSINQKNLKSPIIIISPSTSALLTLNNIKAFLEDSQFIKPNSPELPPKPASGVVVVNHPSDRLHPAAHKITIVDNVEVFTKPDYWDRVIAIFTTGQSWQFAKYKQNRPELLFQRYPGFFFCYQGELVPPQIKDWNVNEIKIDRDKRFRDKMIAKDFWLDIEKILIQKGYGSI